MNTTVNISNLIKDFKTPVDQTTEIIKLLEKAQINTNTRLEKLPALFSVIQNFQDIDIFTEGNISVIKGKAKSRKSFAVSLILGSYLTLPNLNQVFRGKTKKICILFDTEQSSFYVQQSMIRILNIADQSEYTTRFFAFCLRPYPPDLRLKMIEYIIYNLKPLGLIAIDGIRDLVKDINSCEEATMISSKLLKWTEETGCHIINVLHENKADGNARGHIGTELINKAETILRVEKNPIRTDLSVISCDMVRGLDFENIYFTIEENTPMIVEYTTIEKKENGL